MSTNTNNSTESVKIEGMTCINCALNIEKAVKKIGVQNVHVNFASKELIYETVDAVSNIDIEKAIKGAGFSVLKDHKEAPVIQTFLSIFSFSLAAYFMISMFFHYSMVPVWVDASLAAIALGLGFYKFGKGAFYSVKSGSANMYVLILLGATTAYFFSIYLYITQPGAHLYFETTAVLIALVLLGDLVEDLAIKKTIAAFSKLAEKKISKVNKLVNGQIVEIGINEVKIGDTIQANLGDEIHADAKVIEGNALLDEAIISGESLPIQKTLNSSLIAGSKLVQGNLVYQVLTSPQLSTKALINKLVQDASSKKANIQKLADKISAIFVPLIIGIAVLSFLLNYFVLGTELSASIIRSVAILVISCPCAMGLATPISIFVALGKMTKHGILVKNANAFENFAKIDQLILDKTGTLTTGQFEVANFQSFEIKESEAKALIVALEQKSSHPIAKSILAALSEEVSEDLISIEEESGSGMKAKDKAGNIYKFGSASYTLQNESQADLFLTKNETLLASLRLEDELKDGTTDTLSYFKNAGVKTLVLSGDKQEKCDHLSHILKTEIRGGLKPEDKLEAIKKLKSYSSAMVGDGVNDAPSLSLVNVGISFMDASHLAVESSDIILMNSKISSLKLAHKIAKQSYQTIQQNLFWAFSYNLVAIPLAALGIINPMWAAFFMIFSDLVVVGNAFFLKLRKV